MELLTLVQLTAEIVSSQVANNQVATGEVPTLVNLVHEALSALLMPAAAGAAGRTPVVPVKSSVKPDKLICLECGEKRRTLTRHLGTAHGLTPEEYRAAYHLPGSYPMSAPNSLKLRRDLAVAAWAEKKTSVNATGTKARRKAPPSRKA